MTANILTKHLILFRLLCSCVAIAKQPNILFIYVDDVGFNDFGFNQNTQTQTPFIDNMVHTESLLIEQNYVSFVCSPTRAQMLSGRYASKLGLQHSVFMQNTPYSLTRQVSLLSNEFQSSGYSTHLIGKFHLGFQAWEYTPTYRGFDTFNGFYNGEETYFSHMAYVKGTDLIYYDLRNNEETDLDVTDYSVYQQRDQFLSLLDDIHTNENPFFIYLAFQAAHFPPQAPVEYASKYCNPSDDDSSVVPPPIPNRVRPPYRSDDDASDGDGYLSGDCTAHDMHMAQMTSIDDAMEVIVNRMKDLNVWQDTLIVFSSDNGGAMFSGDNAPLRGGKTTPFEGGVRVPAFVSGGYLNEARRGQTLSEFAVHATDWYPTLLSAANVDVNYERSKRLYATADADITDAKWDYIDENEIVIELDGENIWNAIQNGVIDDELIDREILLHLDEINCPYDACGALRYQNWKYIRGPYVCGGSVRCGWNNQWMTDPDNNVLNCPMVTDDGTIVTNVVSEQKEESEYDFSGMTCVDGCLFNLDTDPCEVVDVKDDNADVVEIMQNKLLLWQQKSVMPLMGENEIILEDDEIIPTTVCDSEYWCPYQQYDEVQFEHILRDEYLRLYGANAMDDDERDSLFPFGDLDEKLLLNVIGLFTLIALICALYIKLRKGNRDSKPIYQESAPLL